MNEFNRTREFNYTAEEIRVGNERLLELAAHLDTVDEAHAAAGEPAYDQRHENHNCGTPACAGGHWNQYIIKKVGDLTFRNEHLSFWNSRTFAVNYREWEEIFGSLAPHKTAKDAATFIRELVAGRTA